MLTRERWKVLRADAAVNGDASRSCAWCSGPIPDAARRDAITCSKSCRQARHRFRAAVGVAPAGGHDARPTALGELARRAAHPVR